MDRPMCPANVYEYEYERALILLGPQTGTLTTTIDDASNGHCLIGDWGTMQSVSSELQWLRGDEPYGHRGAT